MSSQLSDNISANAPIREGPASMIGSACRSGRTSPAFKKPRGHLLSQSVCVNIQANRCREESELLRKECFLKTGVSSADRTVSEASLPHPRIETEFLATVGPDLRGLRMTGVQDEVVRCRNQNRGDLEDCRLSFADPPLSDRHGLKGRRLLAPAGRARGAGQ